MSEVSNTHALMRQARKAVIQENFAEAEKLYGLVLQDPEMQNLLDIKTRYAFCVEKIGNIEKAVELYQEIVAIYQQSGEKGAAKALELKISILQSLHNKTPLTENEQASQNETIQHLDDATLDYIRQLNLGTRDLDPDASSEVKKHDTADDVMKFLSLGTQDLSHYDDVQTQELSSKIDHGNEPIIADEEENEETQDLSAFIERGMQENATQAEQGDSVELELSTIDGVISTANIEVPHPDVINQNDEREQSPSRSESTKNTPPSSTANANASTDETNNTPKKDDDALVKLKALIRQGIKGNLTRRREDEDIDVALTSIGDHQLELAEPEQPKAPEVTTTKMDISLKEKAAKLFGSKK